MHLCTLTRLQPERKHTFYGLCFQGSDNIAISKSEFGNINRNPRKCRESFAKAEVPKPSLTSQLATVAHPMSPHNEADYFISRRKQLHDIKTGHITTMHAEGSFTAKKWLGHRAGWSPCAHSIGKFFLLQIVKISSSNGTVRRESSRKRFL